MDFIKKCEEINKEIKNPRDAFEALAGFEVVLESFVYKIYDLFGRNALLSMTYQIGSGPGSAIANRILKEKGIDKMEDPLEALKILLNENRTLYSVQIKSMKLESIDDQLDNLVITINNRCFYRESLKKRPRLKIGGPLCRINKAYYETAFKVLTGLKCEIDFIKNDEEKDFCIETITFMIPKDYRSL